MGTTLPLLYAILKALSLSVVKEGHELAILIGLAFLGRSPPRKTRQAIRSELIGTWRDLQKWGYNGLT